MKIDRCTQARVLTLCLSTAAIAQAEGDIGPSQPATTTQIRIPADDTRLHLKYGVFDPLRGTPMIAEGLLAGADTNLYIVQFPYAPIDADRDALRAMGAKLHSPLPHNALIARMTATQATLAADIEGVRWIGPYQPAYRLEPQLLTEHITGQPIPTRKYNMVMADKRQDKNVLQRKIVALGGKVTDRHDGGLLFTAELTGAQLIQAARLDEVLWIDRWGEEEEDMDNARIVQGSNYIEVTAGYDGTGVIGHIFEGLEVGHVDWNNVPINVASAGNAQRHGHCTAGCVMGNGTSAPQARGHAPGIQAFYTEYQTRIGARNAIINTVVNAHQCMFTTASWGGSRTLTYTAISADADDIVFDHRIPWTQSQSNSGSQMSRPEAWAKNVISVGGLVHNNNADPADDAYGPGTLTSPASTGPAADGRNKPDLCNFYENVWTSDLTGAPGYTAGNSRADFQGTSAATPITAGLNALAIQMYTDHILGNTPRVVGGSRFQNRPYAQTLKALQIACASPYAIGAASTRAQQGWGVANVRTIYDRRDKLFIVPEDQPIEQGQTHTYDVDVAAGETDLKVCMTYLDPQGNVAAAIDRINDLTVRVIAPGGAASYWGNNGLVASNVSAAGGAADTIDTVECVFLTNPAAGRWTIEVTAPTIAQDANIATAVADATYALVVNGARRFAGCARYLPDDDPTTGMLPNSIPFGTTGGLTSLPTIFASNNIGGLGGAVYLDITAANNVYLHGLDVNTDIGAGTDIIADIYYHADGTYAGNEADPAYWTAWTTAKGTAAALDSPSALTFNRGLYIPGGVTVTIAVVARNFGHRYTNGANSYSDANITVDTGAATNVPFTAPVWNLRTANINCNYKVDASPYHNQIYQQVLRSDDLGPAGSITGLAFAPSTGGRHYNRQLRVRMAHVPAGYVMSDDFATNIAGATTVLDENYRSWHTYADTWCEVGLESAFAYNGNDDVVVEIYARGNHQSEGAQGGFWRGSEQRLYAHGWAWNAQPATGTLSNAALKIRVDFECAETGEFGTSCGPARADGWGTPEAGTFYWFDLHDAAPNSAAFLILGLNSTRTDLTTFGWTNCVAWNDNVASVLKLVSGNGLGLHPMMLPNTTTFDGLKVYGYWANLDASQPGGMTFTNGIRLIIGQEGFTNPNS